ncbi:MULTISPECIES: AAA family ATPase [Pseudonocardia]|uniref:Topology modulation protein n=2 Tax=Pseudonocardia TaxID=1847 RepID=A0A1Y2MPD9_PSEAH|nr:MULTISPECIES: AAA family ATPase [Pseudonocardia]OSY36338.1 topology modulation protein [Pseudonocardia autotrophica]TDN72704.1 adenylate kinase family enzyme [Pseudonocardia autotrophica]BBG03417.1 adenylate kinase [Pseudonocardia autotrophica]GEC27228.1 adenylate kinase [Pseudonocardia saturnea]
MLGYDAHLPHRPRRIAVAGVSGSGKTTLAARIATLTGGPHTDIDGLFHGPGWTPRESFLDDVRALVAADAWTTEWQYRTARPLIAQHADLLVWLDLPFWTTTFPRVLRRTLGRRRHHTVLWNGNVEPPLRTLFTDSEHILRWAVSTRRKYADQVPAIARELPSLTVVRLRSATQVEQWITGPLRNAVHRHRE